MLTNLEIQNIVQSEAVAARAWMRDGKLGTCRSKMLQAYHREMYGDEEDGRSKVVTSEVYDTVEGLTPSIYRVLTRGRKALKFKPNKAGPLALNEAKQKTEYFRQILKENDGFVLLNKAIKECLFQYGCVLKVSHSIDESLQYRKFEGLVEEEVAILLSEDAMLEEVDRETVEEDGEQRFNVNFRQKNAPKGKISIDMVPMENFLMSENNNNPFRGEETPMTRADMIAMFPEKEDLINSLPPDNKTSGAPEKIARNPQKNDVDHKNVTHHRPSDILTLCEYYPKIDVDEDGTAELIQVFEAGNELIEWDYVETDPYVVGESVLLAHTSLQTCAVEPAYQWQRVGTVVTRQGLDNMYFMNHQRHVINQRVNLDDYMNGAPGVPVRIDDKAEVNSSISPLGVQPMLSEILGFKQNITDQLESSVGFTKHGAGLDPDSLANKTFGGTALVMDASQSRTYMYAETIAHTLMAPLMEKVIKWISRYQNDRRDLLVLGETLTIHPRLWGDNAFVDISIGSGEMESRAKVATLSAHLELLFRAAELGMTISDEKKIQNTVSMILEEQGFINDSELINDPEIPLQTLLPVATNAIKQVEQLQQQLDQQNVVVEAERTRAEGQIIKQDLANEHDMNKTLIQIRQKERESLRKQQSDLTKLEVESKQNIPGSLV